MQQSYNEVITSSQSEGRPLRLKARVKSFERRVLTPEVLKLAMAAMHDGDSFILISRQMR